MDFFKKFSKTTEGRLDKNYWDNKWKQSPVVYNGRALRGKSDRIAVDVKSFIIDNDEMLQQIISRYNLKKGNYDDTALAVQQWVVKFLTYKYDEESVNVPEFWQFPFETLQSEIGDCEDGAILITALLINAGIPAWRTKVAAGYVQSSPTAPQGGHAYNLYLADDGEFRILDWCIVDNRRTLIQTPNGAKRISQLKEGDYVIGYDEEKNEPALTKIEKLGNRHAKNIFKIEFEYGYPIYVTGEHPFFVNGKWIRADELEIGMEPYWVKPQKLFNQFHDHKKDPWRKEAVIKTAKKNRENGVYEKLSERQRNNNVFTWPSVRKKLSENNGMKNPEIVEKVYTKRMDGTISGPERMFTEYCEEHNLPVEFVGDGKFWVRTSDGSKNPDFRIPGTKKLIEVSDKQFEYYRNWEEYKTERKRLFEEKGFDVDFVLYDRKEFDSSINKEKLHSFILNGNKITNITPVEDIKSSKYRNGTTVWNMHCSPHNNYFVNGNLVHNCYYQDSHVQIKDKPLAKNGGQKNSYKDIWFTFNNEHAWAGSSIKVFDSRMSKHMTAKKNDVLQESKDDLEDVLKRIEEKESKGSLDKHLPE